MEADVPIPTPTQVESIRPAHAEQNHVRNFCIIAYIDHGKPTLTDHMLQLIGIAEQRNMRVRYLDRTDIERKHGITIRSQAVCMPWVLGGRVHALNMINTPGRIDLTHEVSRSLAACKGAVLLTDAAQGIEAQTLADLYLAMENDLVIILVLNKIDLPGAQPEKYAAEVTALVGCEEGGVLKVSDKAGEGICELPDRIVRVVPAPVGNPDTPTRAMIFDSVYNTYRGAVTYVRVVDGRLFTRQRVKMISAMASHELLKVDVISPELTPVEGIAAGEVGYLIIGAKDVRQSRVGDTITSHIVGAQESLVDYRGPKSIVFSDICPVDGTDFPNLYDVLERLRLNNAALTLEPESSVTLGFGFRCGFLGLLHLEIIHERLGREFGLDLIVTTPNVMYTVRTKDSEEVRVKDPSAFPEGKISEVCEPLVDVTILTPMNFTGIVMELCQGRRSTVKGMDYLPEERVELHYSIPMTEIVFDFFDRLRSGTRGYASSDHREGGEWAVDLVKADILLNGERVDASSAIIHKDAAYDYGQKMTRRLKELIPRQ